LGSFIYSTTFELQHSTRVLGYSAHYQVLLLIISLYFFFFTIVGHSSIVSSTIYLSSGISRVVIPVDATVSFSGLDFIGL